MPGPFHYRSIGPLLKYVSLTIDGASAVRSHVLATLLLLLLRQEVVQDLLRTSTCRRRSRRRAGVGEVVDWRVLDAVLGEHGLVLKTIIADRHNIVEKQENVGITSSTKQRETKFYVSATLGVYMRV